MKLVGQTPRRVNVLYLAPDGRETKLATGAFDQSHPHLTIEFTNDANDVRKRLREASRWDALLVGWSVPEPDAIALIAHVRQQDVPVAIIAAGEQSLDRYLHAGADECVSRGASFLARLPDAIEVAVGKRQAAAARATEPAVESARPLRAAYGGDIQFLKGAIGSDRSAIQVTALAQAMTDAAAGRTAIDVIVLDHGARDADTGGALADVRRLEISVPVVLLVDPPDETAALRTFEHSVDECLVKTPGWTTRLALRLGLVCARHRQKNELETLRQREARLRAMVDRLPACVVRLSAEGAILAMNPVALDLVGAAELRQILRKPFQALVSPGDIEACTDFVQRVAGGEQRSVELELTTLAGAGRVVDATAVPVPAEDGRPGSVLMVLRDATERKRLEAAIEHGPASDAATPAPIIEPTSIAEAPFALEPRPSQDPPPGPAIDPAQLRAMEADLARLCGGARATFQSLEDALREAEAQHDAALARQRDAYAALEATHLERWRSYEAFVTGAHLGICQIDEQGTLVEANQAFAEALGYDSPAVLVASATVMSALTEADPWTRAVAAWRDGSPEAIETRWRRSDGTLLALRLTGRLRHTPEAGVLRIEVVAENLTAQRALEAQVRRARRWEEVARLTTGIAADLRSAVEDMTESARLVSRDAPLDEHARHQVTALESAVSKAADLSRQLVAFGRRGARAPEPLDVNTVVRALEDLMRRLLDEHIELSLALAPQLELVEGERAVLEEALVTLAVGAGEVLPAGGRVQVSTASVELDAATRTGLTAGDYIRVSLSAQGWGASTLAPETSVGFVSARRALARLGGALVVEAVSDDSVTFTGYLPQTSVSILADDSHDAAGDVALRM